MHAPSQTPRAPVYLVGAGPGDPRFLTLRAAECLARADVILYDCSVDARALETANPSAELFRLGGLEGGTGRWPLDEVVARLVEASQAGKTAVHLKDGDPELFSHGHQELEGLRRAGVPVEVVPGVTAATAAAALAEIPITHAEMSSAVALVTARQQHDEPGASLDFAEFGRFPGTLIVYMPNNDPAAWTRSLIEGGRSARTPVVLIADVARPEQRIQQCTLGDLAATIAKEVVSPRLLAVIGPVAELAPPAGWYASRPLFGQRVLLTRPRDQSGELVASFRELGAAVVVQPAIEIGPPPDWQPVDEAMERLDRYDWLVFSSVNGVDYLVERLLSQGHDLRRLAHVQLAAIGPATAKRLAYYRLATGVVPAEYRAEALAEALAADAAGKRFLLARASRGREVLAERLRQAGAEVDQVVVYTSRDVREPDLGVAETLRAGRVDWVTVTSSAIARALDALFGTALDHSRLASISPITSQTLRELGHEPAVEATEFTMGGLVDAILNDAGAARGPTSAPEGPPN